MCSPLPDKLRSERSWSHITCCSLLWSFHAALEFDIFILSEGGLRYSLTLSSKFFTSPSTCHRWLRTYPLDPSYENRVRVPLHL